MQPKYQIFEIREKEICVPSDGYFGEKNDWRSVDIPVLVPGEILDTLEEAMEIVKQYPQIEFTILPIYNYGEQSINCQI